MRWQLREHPGADDDSNEDKREKEIERESEVVVSLSLVEVTRYELDEANAADAAARENECREVGHVEQEVDCAQREQRISDWPQRSSGDQGQTRKRFERAKRQTNSDDFGGGNQPMGRMFSGGQGGRTLVKNRLRVDSHHGVVSGLVYVWVVQKGPNAT